jgi:S1-C subfamily serine protease
MKKAPLYSRSPRNPGPAALPTPPGQAVDAPEAAASRPATQTVGPSDPGSSAPALQTRRDNRAPLWAATGALFAVAAMLALQQWPSGPRVITQADIDAAVRESLEKEPLPSAAAKAYEAILPSVVRVTGLMRDEDDDEEADQASGASPDRSDERSVGTGVVIVDNGTILTNLHVVAGAKRLRVRFANGQTSDAYIVGAQPENDLAVLRATRLPDDMQAATMKSTSDLRPGDHVIAVGNPFGIGPSVSHGVVSGLKREFRSPEGEKTLTNLIQFDAAANPGNSGGPLVTMDGHVVGIVTAILNPSEQRTFIGIGFAVPIENAAAAAGMPPF